MRSLDTGLPDLTIPGRNSRERARLCTSIRTHYVYTAWDAEGRALYVGCTYNVDQRMSQHRRSGAEWYSRMATVTTTAHSNRAKGRQAEAERIFELRPEVNVIHNPRNWAPDYSDDYPPTVRERKAEALRALRAETRATA